MRPTKQANKDPNGSRDGSALAVVVLFMLLCSMLGWGLLREGELNAVGTSQALQSAQAFWVAEAGVQHAVCRLLKDTSYRAAPTPLAGSLGGGSYSVTVSRNAQTYSLAAEGAVRDRTRTLEASVNVTALPKAFAHYAVFGSNTKADYKSISVVSGDVFQYGNVKVEPGASILGNIYATGTIDGGTGAPLPTPLPAKPTLNTTYYDNQIALANNSGVESDDIGPVLNLPALGGSVYIEESFGNYSGHIIGPGTVVAYGDLDLHGALVDDGVTCIAKNTMELDEDTVAGRNCTFYGNDVLVEDRSTVDKGGSLISVTQCTIRNDAAFRGIVFAGGKFNLQSGASLHGSVVADDDITIDTTPPVVTHDTSVLPASLPPGLGASDELATAAISSWREH